MSWKTRKAKLEHVQLNIHAKIKYFHYSAWFKLSHTHKHTHKKGRTLMWINLTPFVTNCLPVLGNPAFCTQKTCLWIFVSFQNIKKKKEGKGLKWSKGLNHTCTMNYTRYTHSCISRGGFNVFSRAIGTHKTFLWGLPWVPKKCSKPLIFLIIFFHGSL